MNMFDMMNMLGKVKEVQAKIKQIKDDQVNITAVGESGAGMVKATVNGNRNIIKLEIDPELVKKEEKEMLQDLVVAAINIAIKNVDDKVKEEFKKNTEGLMPNIPGFDLGSMF